LRCRQSNVFRVFVALWLGLAFSQQGEALAALTLDSSFNVTQTYTDNLFFDDNNKKSDVGTAFGPNLRLQYDNPDIVIGGIYSGRFVALYDNFDESRYIQNANIILDLPFLDKQYKGLTVTIVETMTFSPQLDAFAFTGAQNSLTPINSRNRNQQAGGGQGTGGFQGTGGGQGTGGSQGTFTRRTNSFFNRAGVTLTYAWSPSISPSLRYTNQYRTFSRGSLQDSLTHSIIFTLPYMVSGRTTVSPSYTYRQTDFIGSNSNSSADKVLAHSPQIGISYSFTPLVNGTISGGASFNKTKGGTQSTGGTTNNVSDTWQSNAVGSATLTKTYQRGTMALSFNSTIGSGGGLTSQAARSRVLTGIIAHQLTQRLNAFVSTGYAQNKSTTGSALDTRTLRVQTGLGYTITRWLTGNVNYSRIDQNAKASAARDVTVNQVFIGLTATADPWVLIR